MTGRDAAPAAPKQLRLGSMFSGYGGLDLAIESVFGARTVWQAEWEDAPSQVLARHWPGVPNLRDVTAVDWAAVEPVDIIAGGFPCQDVSLAGRRAGMTEGTRSNLWGAMRTAIETIKPTYVVAENVRGLLSAKASSYADEPNAAVSCRACGWRGVHSPRNTQGNVPGKGDHRDDRSGTPTPGTPQGAVGREHLLLPPSDGAMERRMGLVGPGRSFTAAAGGHCAIPGAQGGASPACTGGGAHPGEPAEEAERIGGMDARGSGKVRAHQSAPARTEREGAACPNCGGELNEAPSDMEPGTGLLGDRSGGHLRALGRVLGDLADLGYDAQWCGLRASDVGAPHHRFRVFILATRAADRDGIRGDRPRAPRLEEGRGEPANRGERPADAARNGRDEGRPEPAGKRGGPHAPLSGPHTPDAYGHGRSLIGRVNPEQRHADGRNGPQPHGDHLESATRTDWGPYAAAIHRWEPIVGRRAPAPTVLANRGKHRLSPRFTEFMMGLPDGWVTDTPGIKRNDALKMCGNGVVPQQAAAALNHMLTAAKGTP